LKSLPVGTRSAAPRHRKPTARIDEWPLQQEVVTFLENAGLRACVQPLVAAGFDDMETLLQIEYADIRDLGIAPYHGAVLRRRLKDYRRSLDGAAESSAVRSFLEDAGLGTYAHLLLHSGYTDMQTLLKIEGPDMAKLGVPRGFVLKLKRKLREYELHQCESDQPEFLVGVNIDLQHSVNPPQAPRQRTAASAPAVPASPCGRASPSATSAPRPRPPSGPAVSQVQQSWDLIQHLGTEIVGELLYRHLFTLDTEALELFPLEVRARYRESSDLGAGSLAGETAALRNLFTKYVNAVGCTVAGMHDLTKLVPMLTELGARHFSYGVSEAHFRVMGQALDLTLKEMLGEAYSPEVQSAWKMVYGFMSSIMFGGLCAAREHRVFEPGAGAVIEAGLQADPIAAASQMETATDPSTLGVNLDLGDI